jgi:hypothetical protein
MSDALVNAAAAPGRPVGDRTVLAIVASYALSFVVFGLAVDGPLAVIEGLAAILTSRDTLLTDYFGVGGIGGGLVSAGLLTLAACAVYALSRAKMTGASVAALLLVLGFGLFGKNLLNVWFIVLGVALYARFRGQPFATHINTAFFGIALSPIVSEILFSSLLPWEVAIPLGAATGLLIGFVLPPAAAQLFKAHMGFALYNMGFTAGLVGTLIVALFKSYGFVPDPVFIWTSGNDLLLGPFLGVLFVSMLILGVVLDRQALSGFRRLLSESGQSPSDFIAIAGLGADDLLRRVGERDVRFFEAAVDAEVDRLLRIHVDREVRAEDVVDDLEVEGKITVFEEMGAVESGVRHLVHGRADHAGNLLQ